MQADVFCRDGGSWKLLVHRRSEKVKRPGLVAALGGRVERISCKFANLREHRGFEAGARLAAVGGLREESGLCLPQHCFSLNLPAGPSHSERHPNFGVCLDTIPELAGPRADRRFEVQAGGVHGMGAEAGDGLHAWVCVAGLLGGSGLLPFGRVPLQKFLTKHVAICRYLVSWYTFVSWPFQFTPI